LDKQYQPRIQTFAKAEKLDEESIDRLAQVADQSRQPKDFRFCRSQVKGSTFWRPL
jgi:hypothetical protein